MKEKSYKHLTKVAKAAVSTWLCRQTVVWAPVMDPKKAAFAD